MRAFVYGTLVEPRRVRAVLDSFVFVGPATLDGLHAVSGEYPTLAPGGEVAGRLLRTDEIDALDAYERVDDGLYVRVAVPLRDAYESPTAAATDDRPNGPESDDRPNGPGTDRSSNGAESDSADDTVAVYVGDPARLDAPADWPGDGPFAARVRRYLDDHDVVVRRR